MPSPEEHIEAVFRDLPGEPAARLAAIANIYSAIRKQASAELTPAITSLLKDASKLTYVEKARLSHNINQVLLDARLAILDPQTQMTAKLEVHRPRPSSKTSTLRIRDTRAGDDGRKNHLNADRLRLADCPISLVEAVADPDWTPAPGRPPGMAR